MKIKTKVLIAFSVVFLTILFLLMSSISAIKKLNHSVDDIVNQQYSKVELATRIRFEISDLGKALRNYVLSDSNTIKGEQINIINQARDRGGKALMDLEKMTLDQQGTLIINHLKTVGADYLTFQQKVINTDNAGMVSEASAMLTMDKGNYQLNLFNLVEDLINLNQVSMQKAVLDAKTVYNQAFVKLLSSAIFYLILGIVLPIVLTNRLTKGLAKVSTIMEGFSNGSYDLDTRLEVTQNDEIGTVSKAFNTMAASLQAQSLQEKEWSLQIKEQSWLHENMTMLYTLIQEIDDIQDAAERTLSQIMPQLGASLGILYIKTKANDHMQLQKMASYAANKLETEIQANIIQFGEGLVGQCAKERKIIQLSDVPSEYYFIQSGLGITPAREIIIIPLLIGNEVEGVLEIASLQNFSTVQIGFLNRVSVLFAIHINKIKIQIQNQLLYEQSQMIAQDLRVQTEELILQQEEMAQMNAELEEQTAALEESEQQLQLQQVDLEDQNHTLKQTTLDLERKTQELSDAINYKSLFLANMSHELRTPLNSMLILAKLLAENKEKNLSEKQVEYASIVYSSGLDLLSLINEILELAKVESKKVEISIERIELTHIVEYVKKNFEPIAQQKGLQFNIVIEKNVPPVFYSDQQRLLQIIQNLLSNAFKFTEQGSILFSIDSNEQDSSQRTNKRNIAFIVTDSGIGIEQDKQDIIFDAFVQADGTTSRKYGGTGLGLSISREFSILLGGTISLQSSYGKGSIFTLVLPVELEALDQAIHVDNTKMAKTEEKQSVANKSVAIKRLEDKLILIVDDDIRNVFALTNVIESYGLSVLYAENGSDALDMLAKHDNVDAVLMDIMMPKMDGYETMRHIRNNPKYRNLPIIAVTAKAMKDDKEKCINAGASDYITKPVDMDQLFSLLKVWLYS
jgi:two-component system, chemotaxis family, sensor kinase CheA